jgi:putative transposase
VKREAIASMVIEHELSDRRACALVGLSRDAYRNPAPESALNQQLSAQIIEIAHTRPRAGYRMIHDLLRLDNPGINHKRIYRLYREAGLAVRRKVKAKRYGERVPLIRAETVNQTWSMDFVSDSLSTGRRLKFLTVADDFSRECVQMAVDFGMGAGYVTRLLDEAALFRGYPKAVRTDWKGLAKTDAMDWVLFTDLWSFIGPRYRNECLHMSTAPRRLNLSCNKQWGSGTRPIN